LTRTPVGLKKPTRYPNIENPIRWMGLVGFGVYIASSTKIQKHEAKKKTHKKFTAKIYANSQTPNKFKGSLMKAHKNSSTTTHDSLVFLLPWL
jgi:hypothetical protein